MFSHIAKRTVTPNAWRQLKLTPLYKGKGSELDCSNYRALAVANPLAKLFMALVNCRLNAHACENQLRAETQAGFRAQYSLEDLVLVVQTLVQHANITRSSLALCFVDLQKAYDSIPRAKLWQVLVNELGVPQDLVQVIINMYQDTVAFVSGVTTPQCTVRMNKGVRQGCPASPLLFSLFFDRVAKFLEEKCL